MIRNKFAIVAPQVGVVNEATMKGSTSLPNALLPSAHGDIQLLLRCSCDESSAKLAMGHALFSVLISDGSKRSEC